MSGFELDALYVVSDLHLGGDPGFQIFDQGELFASFVRSLLSEVSAEAEVGLCLDGDVVDFLAVPDAAYFDAEGAPQKLERLMGLDAFRPVFDALAEYLKTPHRRLFVVLGNHDVELALPETQAVLTRRLTGGDDAARGRLFYLADGTGFACTVAGARVLCVHGNEVDLFNVVDYPQLARTIAARKRGQEPAKWPANAGTTLVIDVMNEIKHRYAWVDLVKPIREVVPSLLLALDPRFAAKISAAPAIVTRLARDAMKLRAGFLSLEDGAPAAAVAAAPVSDDPLGEAMDLAFEKKKRPLDVLGPAERRAPEKEGEFLGIGGAIMDLFRKRSPAENIRESLNHWLGGDTTYNPTAPDRTFERVDEMAGPEIPFVIAGHTHLQRSLERKKGQGYYFNCGTWIRLIDISLDYLDTPAEFEQVWNILSDGRMAALDNPAGFGFLDLPLVKRIRTVVSVTKQGAAAVGRLLTVEPSGQSVRLVPVPGCERVWK